MVFFITGERHGTITTSHIEKRYYQRWVFFVGSVQISSWWSGWGAAATGKALLHNYQFNTNDS